MNAQLGTDLAQGPALGVQVGCTLNVHRATVTSLSRIGFPPNRNAEILTSLLSGLHAGGHRGITWNLASLAQCA